MSFLQQSLVYMLHYTLNSMCRVELCLFMDLNFESRCEIETMDVSEALIPGLWMYIIYNNL